MMGADRIILLVIATVTVGIWVMLAVKNAEVPPSRGYA